MSQRNILAVLGILAFFSETGHAADAACAPVAQAILARSQAPMEETTTVIPSFKVSINMIRVQGKSYTRTGSDTQPGKWMTAFEDLASAERTMAEQMKSGEIRLSGCKAEGDAVVDGVPVKVISFSITSPGSSKPGSGVIKIGKADGLPYVFTAMGNDTQSRYKDVKAPKI